MAVRFAFSASIAALFFKNASSSCFGVGARGACPTWGVSNQAVAPRLPATASAFSVPSARHTAWRSAPTLMLDQR